MHVKPQTPPVQNIPAAAVNPGTQRTNTRVQVKDSHAQTFSGDAIKTPPATAAPGTTTSLSREAYSADFADAYDAAMRELQSLECKSYIGHLQWVSPGAEEAMHRLGKLVMQKREASRSEDLATDSTKTQPLSREEQHTWETMLHKLPSAYRNYLQSSLAAEVSGSAASTYSPEFREAYQAARQALESRECKFYEDQLGWLSPDAEAAVEHLREVVNIKYDASRSTDAAKEAFSMKPLTPDEHQAWEALVHSLPPVYKTYLPNSSNWKAAEPGEVFRALTRDSAMHTLAMEQPGEFAKFYNELTRAINSKMSDMHESDKGMALTFRFPQCYQTTAHIALAGVWRDEHGDLQISICHQESVPPDPKAPRGSPFTGVVYSGFNTSRDYPGGRAPVMEAMRMAGPPAVNVFPCPHPEAIVKATDDIAGAQHARQYGPSYTWVEASGHKPQPLPPETCFNVTHKVLAAMYRADTHDQPLLPALLPKMTTFANLRRNEFDTITLPDSGRVIRLEDIPSLPFEDQVKAFLRIGQQWGEALPWDVPLQTVSKTGNITLKPGQTGVALPPGARGIKFLTPKLPLKLGSQPVQSGVTYTAGQAQAMEVSGKEAMNVRFVYSVHKEASGYVGAKL